MPEQQMPELRTLVQSGHVASLYKRFDALRDGQIGKRQGIPGAKR